MNTFSKLYDVINILSSDWSRPKFRFHEDIIHATFVFQHIRGLDTRRIQ